MARKFSWKQYEAELLKGLSEAIQEVMGQYPEERFYGAAFHSFYREHGDRISMPCLAVNTEEELAGDFESRWSAPDWYWDDLDYQSSKLLSLHHRFDEFASSKDDQHWETLHSQWMESLVRVAKQLTSKLKRKKQATGDFGFFLFDEESNAMVDVLRRCMTAAKFKKLFPDLMGAIQYEQRTEKLPVSKRIALYASDLTEENCAKLLALGAKAVPALVNVLKSNEDDKIGPARMLGLLGVKDQDAIKALKEYASHSVEPYLASHAAYSLALLGETEYLLNMAKKAKTRTLAIGAIKRLYSGFLSDNSVVYVPLDYRPLEHLLTIDSCRKPAQKPRDTSYYFSCALERREINAADVDEAIRGTKSKYKMIREHSVCCLGNRSLGKACSQKAMQAIVDCFEDRTISVRRLAVINIQHWKKMAEEHLPAIRRLARKDSDPDVRDAARSTVYWLT